MVIKELNPVQVGDISEAKVLTRFVELGHGVLIPWSNGLRYDLVVDFNQSGNLQRIQIKTGRIQNGCIVFNAASQDPTDRHKKINYRGDIDSFGVYCRDNGKTYIVPVEHAPTMSCYLRVEPPKNNQRKGIRWAKDYEL
ncbi:MAG: group I intron-associated PD-(D/E)XK endonuclease [Anaerolineae bacterium]|nr:group I intron-associated PD-(D/E)XK endonuclease [Anaerolineae bacterium]MDQ7037256.1 group I intron-associated PD-(D/E)XK endonuclease [Anaerolineae bacterium]